MWVTVPSVPGCLCSCLVSDQLEENCCSINLGISRLILRFWSWRCVGLYCKENNLNWPYLLSSLDSLSSFQLKYSKVLRGCLEINFQWWKFHFHLHLVNVLLWFSGIRKIYFHGFCCDWPDSRIEKALWIFSFYLE